uniref:hypothetical protein n=1 Tax=Pseudoalteromonas aliena TaxID=247523 RepID=UPI002494DA1A
VQLLITLSTATIIVFVNPIYGRCPSRKQASRLQKHSQTYALAVDVELAHERSEAFNYFKHSDYYRLCEPYLRAMPVTQASFTSTKTLTNIRFGGRRRACSREKRSF